MKSKFALWFVLSVFCLFLFAACAPPKTSKDDDNTDADTTAPYTWGHSPAKNAISVARDTNIVVHIKDVGVGVKQSTIVMMVEGQTVTPDITGTSVDYTLTYNPPIDFADGQEVDVILNASDLNGNAMTQDSYSFTTASQNIVVMDYDDNADDTINNRDTFTATYDSSGNILTLLGEFDHDADGTIDERHTITWTYDNNNNIFCQSFLKRI